MNYIHIGLGKTATTMMQNYVFPTIAKQLLFNYNEYYSMILLKKFVHYELTSSDKKYLSSVINKNNNLISYERLINWNPHYWKSDAERNIELFGKNSHIIITVRDPKQYFRSIYQQQIHNGNIIKPEYFFVNSETYSMLKRSVNAGLTTVLDVDQFDYEKLLQLYRQRFRNVTIVSYENIASMHFLDKVFGLSEAQSAELKQTIANVPRFNRSYSKYAMKLTFVRESIANMLGLTTHGKYKKPITQRLESFDRNFKKQKSDSSPKNELKFFHYNTNIKGWRKLMQGYFDNIYPYEQYNLPEELYLNEDLCEKNRKFIQRMNSGGDIGSN